MEDFDLEKKDVRPRDFLARMMLSNSSTPGEFDGATSRSWMNSLNAIKC